MTKEKLEKDVKTYLRQQFGLNGGGMVSCDLKKLLLGFAEPREKQIEDLENKIADIKANCDLAIEGRDIKIRELEKQIEKMKCCQNCKNLISLAYGEFSCNLYGECKHCSKWEIEENGN